MIPVKTKYQSLDKLMQQYGAKNFKDESSGRQEPHPEFNR
jgi:hypothetical protein